MKLIIREYLSSLRERGELDAILPDLLSQLGLNVYSRPGRGTRQDGVDVAAVGKLNGETDKAYLLSIKAGNLTRTDWDGGSPQALRPSLNEIRDAYIPNRLPVEHREKPIVICIVVGGDVQEQVRRQLTGYIAENTTDRIAFEEWNGDKLAELIQAGLLREDLLPKQAQSRIRKALALLDEPDVSFGHFAAFIRSFSVAAITDDQEAAKAIRQIAVSVWILFAWAREAKNMESAYLSSERALLHGWEIAKRYAERKDKEAHDVRTGFLSIFFAYRRCCSEFLSQNVLESVGVLHGLSNAVRASSPIDVNLKLFDLLGRVATQGLWSLWDAGQCEEEGRGNAQEALGEAGYLAQAIKAMISCNPVLLSPIKDSEAIDIAIGLSLLAPDPDNRADIKAWIGQVLQRSAFAYQGNGRYPCILQSYSDLLLHPKVGDHAYREEVTVGSILYPVIALWAAILRDPDVYSGVSKFKQEHLKHCNFQVWYPDEQSEERFYTNGNAHGAVLSDVCVERAEEEMLAQVFGECDTMPHYDQLSAVQFGWWPLVVVACRHYRLPLPVHLWRPFREQAQHGESESNPAAADS